MCLQVALTTARHATPPQRLFCTVHNATRPALRLSTEIPLLTYATVCNSDVFLVQFAAQRVFPSTVATARAVRHQFVSVAILPMCCRAIAHNVIMVCSLFQHSILAGCSSNCSACDLAPSPYIFDSFCYRRCPTPLFANLTSHACVNCSSGFFGDPVSGVCKGMLQPVYFVMFTLCCSMFSEVRHSLQQLHCSFLC